MLEVKLHVSAQNRTQNTPNKRFLFQARLSDSENCRVCQTEPETLPHMLFQCNIASAFWIAFEQRWCERTLHAFELNECNVISGCYNDTQRKDT